MSDTTDKSPAETSPYQRAAMVARHVNLHEVWLINVRSSLFANRKTAGNLAPWRLAMERAMKHSFDADENLIVIDARLRASALPKEGGSDEPILTVEATFGLEYCFHVDGGPPPDERDLYFGAFAEINGVFNVWPYFRELVQSLTTRSGLPPLVLPVFRVETMTKPSIAPPQPMTSTGAGKLPARKKTAGSRR